MVLKLRASDDYQLVLERVVRVHMANLGCYKWTTSRYPVASHTRPNTVSDSGDMKAENQLLTNSRLVHYLQNGGIQQHEKVQIN